MEVLCSRYKVCHLSKGGIEQGIIPHAFLFAKNSFLWHTLWVLDTVAKLHLIVAKLLFYMDRHGTLLEIGVLSRQTLQCKQES